MDEEEKAWEPCPCVAGYFPELPPVPRALGKGAAVPERILRSGGYVGRVGASYPDGGAGRARWWR